MLPSSLDLWLEQVYNGSTKRRKPTAHLYGHVPPEGFAVLRLFTDYQQQFLKEEPLWMR